MNVKELIHYLSTLDPAAEVELAIVAPVEEDVDDITVDRYSVDAVYPWDRDDDNELRIWLVGGEEEDVDAFIDALEDEHDDNDHEHD